MTDKQCTEFLYEPKDKILIFGGTGGLGQQLSPVLAQHFEVHCLGKKDVPIELFCVDSSPRGRVKLIEFIADHKPQAVVNMATLNVDKTVAKLDDRHEIYNVLEVSVMGSINILQASLKYFRTAGKGTYIYMSSVLSTHPVFGAGLYSAGKAFNDNLIKTAALENAKYNITCNSIQLGYFPFGLGERLPETMKQSLVEKIPMKRFGDIQSLALTIKYLHEVRYLTGSSIELSGGLSV